MSTPPWPQERAFPRLQYPSHLRPYLVTRRDLCEVVDCSERGLRYGSALDLPAVGSLVSGRLCFRGGTELEVRGRVVRVQSGEVALELEESSAIPPEVMAAEEAALRDA